MAAKRFTERHMFYNGRSWPVTDIIALADGAHSLDEALHYTTALQNNAFQFYDKELISIVSAIHKKWKVDTNGLPAAPRQLPSTSSPIFSPEGQASTQFNRLNDEAQKAILSKALTELLQTGGVDGDTFTQKNHWMAIFIVLRDRLQQRLKQNAFADYAQNITPECWPDDIRIGKNTMTNFHNYITEDVAYYAMKHNPFNSLCSRFWDILMRYLLTCA